MTLASADVCRRERLQFRTQWQVLSKGSVLPLRHSFIYFFTNVSFWWLFPAYFRYKVWIVESRGPQQASCWALHPNCCHNLWAVKSHWRWCSEAWCKVEVKTSDQGNAKTFLRRAAEVVKGLTDRLDCSSWWPHVGQAGSMLPLRPSFIYFFYKFFLIIVSCLFSL